MKIELCPEDMLLEYTQKRLRGNMNPTFENRKYLKYLPFTIDISQEFLDEWKAMVIPTINKLVTDIFCLREFILEEGSGIKKYCAIHPEFWERVEFKLSDRGVARAYELMLEAHIQKPPAYRLAADADALIISLMTQKFGLYSHKWLIKNKASWLIKALFIRLCTTFNSSVTWEVYFDKSHEVELPLREFLIEAVAGYLKYIIGNISFDFACENNQRSFDFESEKQEFNLNMSGHRPTAIAELDKDTLVMGNRLIKKLNESMQIWCNQATITMEDERFLQSAYNKYQLKEIINDWNSFEEQFNNTNNLSEAIIESVNSNGVYNS